MREDSVRFFFFLKGCLVKERELFNRYFTVSYFHHYQYQYHNNALAGYYMYIETSLPRQQGDNAKLQVTVPGNGAAACLFFYYHMYGDTIGTLNVYSGNELVFHVSGNQSNHWIRARETIYLRHTVSLMYLYCICIYLFATRLQ